MCSQIVKVRLLFFTSALALVFVTDNHKRIAEPSKQFALVRRHIDRIRTVTTLAFSEIVIMCE